MVPQTKGKLRPREGNSGSSLRALQVPRAGSAMASSRRSESWPFPAQPEPDFLTFRGCLPHEKQAVHKLGQQGQAGEAGSEGPEPTCLCWAPRLVLPDGAGLAHARAEADIDRHTWEPEGVRAPRRLHSTHCLCHSIMISSSPFPPPPQMRTPRFRGARFAQGHSSLCPRLTTPPPPSPAHSLSPAAQEPFCASGEAGPPASLPRIFQQCQRGAFF